MIRRPFPARALVAAAVLCVWTAARADAQDAPEAPAAGTGDARAGLDYGPHPVGFTLIEALDSTRAFRPLRDFRGAFASETARPVQVSVWYPASGATDGPRMRAGDFRLLTESELDYDAVPGPGEAARLRSEFVEQAVGFGQDREAAARTWDEPTPAARDAPPLPGPHPTVLYFTSAGVSNPLLPAYLASHGFVVASFPSNGRMTEVAIEFTPNALTLDTDVDDAGFVHALLRRLPYADTRRLAAASFSGGSLAALLWAMRDMQPSALVSFEGWERYRRGADIVRASVLYEPHRVRTPFLMVERSADEASPQYAKVPDVVGSLPHADITRVAFRDAAHGDFLSHVPFGHTPDQPRIFATSARMARLFLEATLLGGEAAADTLAALAPPPDDPFFTVTRDPAVARVPTEEELFRLAETDPDALGKAFHEASAVVPGDRLFREAVLTRAARFAAAPRDRAAIMAVVAAAYPRSTAAAFGLGQALAEAGRAEEAAAAFRSALEAVPADPSLDDASRREWRERIESALKGAGG